MKIIKKTIAKEEEAHHRSREIIPADLPSLHAMMTKTPPSNFSRSTAALPTQLQLSG